MSEALSIAATGMQAQQASLDTIANNIANMNTVAFKKGRVGFADLMMRDVAPAAALAGDEQRVGALVPSATLGAGVSIASLAKVFDMGELKKTDSAFDVAIEGEGFIEVMLTDGSSAFTRGGTLKVNKDGLLATSSGHALKPGISVPDKAEAIVIGRDGRVQARMPNQTNLVELGQLEIVRFSSAAMLTPLGDNLYRVSAMSGEPTTARPGEEGAGTFMQGFLEMSNVKLVDEMVGLMMAQRAFEASLKVLQAADEMAGLGNNMRK